MRELDVNGLRALIKLIPPLRALREDVEKSLHLEMYASVGDLAVRSLTALCEQIYEVTQDRYVASLVVDPNVGGDREKFSQVLLVSGQLLAYLEAQTGVNVTSTGRQQYSVQTAPNVHLNMGDVVGGQADKIMDFVESAMRGVRPPKPPKAPKPPKGPKGVDLGDDFPFGKKPKRGEGFFYVHDTDDDDDDE
jgi:hypothetical protein